MQKSSRFFLIPLIIVFIIHTTSLPFGDACLFLVILSYLLAEWILSFPVFLLFPSFSITWLKQFRYISYRFFPISSSFASLVSLRHASGSFAVSVSLILYF